MSTAMPTSVFLNHAPVVYKQQNLAAVALLNSTEGVEVSIEGKD